LVADNDERNGNLDSAVKLRTIANRYYFNDDHEVEIERPKGVRAYLFGFQPVSDVEVRELAEATLEWLPGSVHLRPYTKLSQYSHANDLEYQLFTFTPKGPDGDCEMCLLVGNQCAFIATMQDGEPELSGRTLAA
jgi:hypothetical protein